MQAQMAGVQAELDLRDNPWGTKPMLSTDEFYDLILAATGSEKEAHRKATIRRREMIRNKQEPV